MQRGALTLLNAGLIARFLIVHGVEAGVASVEHLIIILGLQLWLRIVAPEPRHSISLVGIQRILIALLTLPPLPLPLQAIFILRLLLNELTVHALLRPTLEHFLEVFQVLDVALYAQLLHVLLKILLNHCLRVRRAQGCLHQVVAVVASAWTSGTKTDVVLGDSRLLLDGFGVGLLENTEQSIKNTRFLLDGRTVTLLLLGILNILHRYDIDCLLPGLAVPVNDCDYLLLAVCILLRGIDPQLPLIPGVPRSLAARRHPVSQG